MVRIMDSVVLDHSFPPYYLCGYGSSLNFSVLQFPNFKVKIVILPILLHCYMDQIAIRKGLKDWLAHNNCYISNFYDLFLFWMRK